MGTRRIVGWREQWLRHHAAVGELTPREMADRIGVPESAVRAWTDENPRALEAERGALAERLRDLWIADKAARLAELQLDADDLREAAALALADGDVAALVAVVRARVALLQLAAAETNDLPGANPGEVVTYRLELPPP